MATNDEYKYLFIPLDSLMSASTNYKTLTAMTSISLASSLLVCTLLSAMKGIWDLIAQTSHIRIFGISFQDFSQELICNTLA